MGRLTLLLSSLLALVLVLSACGDNGEDSDTVLLLATGPVAEPELRSTFRREFMEANDILNLLCRATHASDSPTVMALTAQLLGEDGTTAQPGPDGVDRVMEIIRQECLALAQ